MKKHILVTTFWSFKDALVQTYTLPYLKIMHKHLPEGSKIYLLTIEQERYQIEPSEIEEIEHNLEKYNIISIRFPYFSYGFRSLLNWLRIVIYLFFLILFKNIKYIHSFCTTSGMAGYLLSLMTGRTYLIDSYEPHAEASVENGEWKRTSFRFRLLFFLEKMESHRVKYIISATAGMRKYALEKYNATFENFYVKPACVDLDLFSFKNRKNTNLVEEFGYEDKIVCVYAGKFGGIYLDKEIFDFFKVADDYWGDKFRLLILTSHKPAEIQMRCQAVGIDFSKVEVRFVNHAQIADYMGLADFAVTPVKPIPTKRYCTPIKDGEYWALGLPIVITRDISDDSEIVQKHGIGSVMNRFTADEYLRNVKEIDDLLKLYPLPDLYAKVRKVAEQYRSFAIAESIYHEIYGNF
ncbi:MAG: hypothetical protein EAZ08_11845 [Cytophagales bacterium]|nr:MAG: hypothetical protein EAZ08_11845 [Cytophagales bacterium]